MTDDRRLNVALIGCGMIARLAHLPHVVQSDRMRLSVCADLDREAAQTIGGKFNPDRITDDVDSVWDDASVDAVRPRAEHLPSVLSKPGSSAWWVIASGSIQWLNLRANT